MGNRGYALTSACPDLQSAYDSCEKSHLEQFRRGEASIDNPCRDAWEDYKQCVMEVWDAKTQDYLTRRAAARGDTQPPHPPTHTTDTSTTAAFTAAATPLPSASVSANVASSTAASTAFTDTPSSSDQR